MSYSQQQVKTLQNRLQNDPSYFAEKVLGKKLWSKQIEVLESIRDNSHTAVRSGHGVGKSFVSSIAVLWFLYSFRPSKVITTAPTWLQVKSILWSEINKQHRTSLVDLGGEVLQTELKLSSDHFAVGFSTDAPERFQGHHSDNVLIIFDEAPGVHSNIWESAEGLMTGRHARWLAIGNPTSPVGNFYNTFTSPLWHKISISCEDSPNVINNNNEFPGLVTRDWIDQRKEEWGENNPIYKSRVLGEFPVEGEDTLIPLSWVERSIDRKIENSDKDKTFLGVDVARFGSDHTAFVIIKGKNILHIEGYNGRATTETAGKCIELYRRFSCSNIAIDDTGVGGGVVDILTEQKYPVMPVNFGEKAKDDSRFDNLKTEIFWNLREDFEKSNISIPKNDKLISELPSLKYEMTSRGKMHIVSKDKMRKLGLKSPDYADALVIAHFASYASNRNIIDYYREESSHATEEKSLEAFFNRPDFTGNLEGII